MEEVQVTVKTVEQFIAKVDKANELFKQLGQLTRQHYGTKATFEGLNVAEKSYVMESYIKYGGDLS